MKPNSNGAGHERRALERAGDGHERIGLAGGDSRFAQAVLVFLGVLEFKHVERGDIGADLVLWGGIEEQLQAPARADAHVVRAFGADVLVVLDLGRCTAPRRRRTFLPQPLGHGNLLLRPGS